MAAGNVRDGGQVNNAKVASALEDEGLVEDCADRVGRGRVPQGEAI